MDDIQILELLNDGKEKSEIIDECVKINKYKIYLLQHNNESSNEMEQFIQKTIDKYRKKIEVKSYYNSFSGKDELDENRYQLLCTIERMIYDYTIKKAVMDKQKGD